MISKTLSLILVSFLSWTPVFLSPGTMESLPSEWPTVITHGMNELVTRIIVFLNVLFFGVGGGLTIDISSKKYSSHPAWNHYLLFLSHKSTVSKQFSYFIFHMESGSQKLVLEGPQRSVILFIYSIYICWEPFYFRNCFRYWGSNDQDRQESSVQGNKDNWKSS